MKKIIVINKAKLPTIPWKELKAKFEPNTLKQKKDREVGDLKASILAIGFTIPMFIWLEGKYIADGAGRFLALELLEYEGYEIPDVPYVPLEAKSKKEAKRLTMAISSQYGLISPDSIGEFTLDMNEIDLSFINIEGYNLGEIDWTPPKAKEVDMEAMKGETKMKHICPKCSFEWTA
jgi:ParB-like chromosome segregation protein Spo0J